jgi:hypothetical protein
MLKIINIALFVFTFSPLFSQIELKTAPRFWFNNTGWTLGIEYGIKPKLGVELEYQRYRYSRLSAISSNTALFNGGFVALKHYFNKNVERPISKFYIGGYAFYIAGEMKDNAYITSHTIYSFGATTGYKGLLIKQHLVLEACVNLGKRFTYQDNKLVKSSTSVKYFFNEWMSTRLLIGYRF